SARRSRGVISLSSASCADMPRVRPKYSGTTSSQKCVSKARSSSVPSRSSSKVSMWSGIRTGLLIGPYDTGSVDALIDLHTHSHYSDGTLPPAELVERALVRGVSVLALTDHDTTAGLAEAREAAAGRLQLIAGVEITAGWRGQ